MQAKEFFIPNQNTQPIASFPVFNNWDVVAEGWYFICKSKDIKTKQVKSFEICGQQIVVFRDEENILKALDAYCPHMGTHLGVGKVVGKNIQCFFHHWQFNGKGSCENIPCPSQTKTTIKNKAKLQSYQITEAFGAVWIYPGAEAEFPLASFSEFASDDVIYSFGKPYERSCHHHVTMINGIDPQHLKTVHSIDIEMDVQIAEKSNANLIDIILTGQIGSKTARDRFVRKILGEKYSYAMRYDYANNGFLTLMRNVHLFGNGPKLPSLHMIFAYRPIAKGKTFVQPIYVNKKRKGIKGFFINKFLIFITKRAFFALQGEDGLVYENMRFYPQNLLEIDRPIGMFIQYVNKLKPSFWSASWK
jgi:phenylpropionate dioxygenase-like ring-hydroxylating dioxygenase large terminal subunit